uniref:Putative secreted peptide n=1 Tax=Anopheles braziliensis TaxID=58242 RepID=A0A2M3ZUF2_9DIPT
MFRFFFVCIFHPLFCVHCPCAVFACAVCHKNKSAIVTLGPESGPGPAHHHHHHQTDHCFASSNIIIFPLIALQAGSGWPGARATCVCQCNAILSSSFAARTDERTAAPERRCN